MHRFLELKNRQMLQTIEEKLQFFYLFMIGPGMPCRIANEDVPPRGLPIDDWLHKQALFKIET